ncbi:hypothetical protein FRACYDRAFT_259894 [Fragilariopsis cylindrus CCMP1102]|uniref:Uncharacterized protein n=1 Tax=Fragilariopsis cylindrus CCMP1102 TaxID=635003 RepID=A0A1E7FTG6_9STRA|nr:hypothetical protein FRACYDRAFT_259894 [Fragilariopsis cylindrus CCMP1102]|eukprot:OEU21436.1 hypothetical protein FRACYDRAFT_259894 [Fragilariopsis cylindrus CCMP1102]
MTKGIPSTATVNENSCSYNKKHTKKNRRVTMMRQRRQQQQQLRSVDVVVRIPRHSSVLSKYTSSSSSSFQQKRRRHLLCIEKENQQQAEQKSSMTIQTQQSSQHHFNDKRIIYKEYEYEDGDGEEKDDDSDSAIDLYLTCYRPGVLWRGLVPMLFSSSPDDVKTSSANDCGSDSCGSDENENNNSNNNDLLLLQQLEDYNGSILMATKTTETSIPQRTLLALGLRDALRKEIQMITDDRSSSSKNNNEDTGTITMKEKESAIQSLTAWLATLGGGYFCIKKLSFSLYLSRKQRLLAYSIGNIQMVYQCTLNEIYNLIYSGQFHLAKYVLNYLENTIIVKKSSNKSKMNNKKATTTNEKISIKNNKIKTSNINKNDYTIEERKILQQCQSTRLLLRRLKKLSKGGLKRYNQHQHQISTEESSNDNNGTGTISTTTTTSAIVSGHHTHDHAAVTRTKDDYQRVRIASC